LFAGGTTAERLYSDYKNMVGEGIPYRRLGYDSLNNFLKSIPDYCRTTRNNKGEVMVTSVADESTRHMQDLLERSKVKKRLPVNRPTRRPLQTSTHWNPPQQQQQYVPGGRGRFPPNIRPFGRGGGQGPPRGMGRGGGGGPGYNRGGMMRGGMMRGNNRFNSVERTPLREPRANYGRGVGPRAPGSYNPGPKGYPSSKQIKSPPRPQQNRQNSKPQTNYKEDLEKYFNQNNLGEVPYKVAAVGTKGKEKFMATVTVEGTQFKTYPQTYSTRVRFA